jgi:glycerol-3-phosphate acyltransferase PlsY
MTWRGGTAVAIVGGFLLLLVRGVLLWLIIPFAVICWLLSWPWLQDRDIMLAHILGWLDLNLIAALTHSLLLPLVRRAAPFQPLREMGEVTHRIRGVDPS